MTNRFPYAFAMVHWQSAAISEPEGEILASLSLFTILYKSSPSPLNFWSLEKCLH